MTKPQPPTSNDYLWDGSGTPDANTERIERLLGSLRRPLPPAPIARLKPRAPSELERDALAERGDRVREASAQRRYAGLRYLAPTLAAAAAIVLMIASTWQGAFAPRAWDVERLAGRPQIGATPLTDTGRIAVGQTIETDRASRARMDVSTIGQVVVDNDTRVRLVATRRAHHKLALERGTLHAFITAPPGQFVVDTPSSTATDLGCVYTLHVDEDGTGLLSVTAGWVAFEYKGRESFVPAGASARTDEERGPGTPRYDDADDTFKNALDQIDYESDSPKKMAAASNTAAMSFVLEHARPKDAMTLWHLIARVGPSDRPAVVDALAARAPMPAGVTREAILRLDRGAMDLWWDSLGLRDAGWWRKWKRERIW